jgi:hypothetical protein
MWNDNETEIDLLGFDYLVDSLEILLTEEDLLPLTVGVLGDWGSGKSSLMALAKARLDAVHSDTREGGDGEEAPPAPSPFITIAFSPWRFEDYTQVKLALIDAVLDAVDRRIADMVDDSEPKQNMAKVKKYFRPIRRFKSLIAPATSGGLMLASGAAGVPLPGEAVALVSQGAAALAGPPAADDDGAGAEPELMESIAQFHLAFEDLLASIKDVQAVVVFIDDMDRCEERAIIDTFETIRLFLNAQKTAYVLGLNEQVIVSALEARYPNRTAADDSRAQQYLEKMIQASVSIPALSEPEVRAYVSLLFASKHLDKEPLQRLIGTADALRANNPTGESMNSGLARDVLGDDLPAALENDLTVADLVGGPLATGLRGNPRQVKRFLNTLQLRLRLAEKRAIPLDPQILAKLMVLEEVAFAGFEQLFIWQNDHNGMPPHIEVGEAVAKGASVPKSDPKVKQEATDWASQPKVHAWLKADPSLVGVSIGPYFTFSRDRLKASIKATELTPSQQILLAELQCKTSAIRQAAVVRAAGDLVADLPPVAAVLLEQLPSALGSAGSRSLIEIASKHSGTAEAVLDELRKIPITNVTSNFVLLLGANFPEDARYHEIAATWKGTPKLNLQAAKALTVYLEKSGKG